MCQDNGNHVHDLYTKRIETIPRIDNHPCRSCGYEASVSATVYRRFSCVWISHSKCADCYL